MGSKDGEGGPLPAGPPLDDVPLQMTASIPNEPIRVTGPFLQIDTQLTNITGSPLELTARPGADISVVREDVVVRPPAFQHDVGSIFTLAPGASWAYKSPVNLGYPHEPSGEIQPLAPGAYQLYAVQHFIPAISRQRPRRTQISHSMCTADRGISTLAD
jgi:hypothetical protein